MLCTVGGIAKLMDDIAPEEWAEDWDNVGLLLGTRESIVSRLMVVLDISPSVVQEAIDKNVDMIISHHPLIFTPMDRILGDTIEGSLIISLISNNIAVYCSHTNLDMAQDGMDDTLAKCFGLKDVQRLNTGEDIVVKPGFGRWGRLVPETPLIEFANLAGQTLGLAKVDIIGKGRKNLDKTISTVALCAGSGSSFIEQAKQRDIDLFVTGEIKYHDALKAEWLDIDVMVVGHFYSEFPGINKLINRLQTIMHSLQYKIDIIGSDNQRSPYSRITL
ncbi:MAG: Nif3-like dinuclear metal center hexameric protein [Clostridiales bacterium]|nr:Nif3-like dinuclear metal center hexameric protein [Clostridiales bacterium]